MFKAISCWLAWITDKTICWDVAENRKLSLIEFESLTQKPDNQKCLTEFQIRSSIEDKYTTEKNNRLIIVLTFFLIILTLVLAIKQ